MAKSPENKNQPDRAPVPSVGFPPELRRRIEAWAAQQDPALGFSEAVHQLVVTSLDADPSETSDAIPVDELNASNDD